MSYENNNNKKQTKKSFYNFLDKKGFYLILLLCVSMVMVTALWVSKQENKYFLTEKPQEEEKEDLDKVEITLVDEGTQEEDIEEEETTKEVGNMAETLKPGKPMELRESPKKPFVEEEIIDEAEAIDGEMNEVIKEIEEEIAASSASSEIDFIMAQPAMGQLGLPYAEDRLVYHKTLEQWRTHKGIDIHGEEGAPVRAALDGEVVEVVNDTLMGITISLKHNNDLITVYSNLSTDAMVKLGQQVTKGQVISGIGKTAANKKEEGPLLHFQVLQDGHTVDPQLYLPKIN